MPPLLAAGFECARIRDRCLLSADDHLPEGAMARHYAALRALGLTAVRDGLPPWLPVAPRLRVAREAGLAVLWDIDHWWRHPDPAGYARRVAEAARAEWAGPLWVCANETALSYRFARQRRATAIRAARTIVTVLRDELPDVRLATSEPAHHPPEVEAHAGLADLAQVIGLNLYPHELSLPIEDALRRARDRWPGHALAITETGLHVGWTRRRRPDLFPRHLTKGGWLRLVLAAVGRSGVPVRSVCLYPAIDGLSWGGDWRNDSGLLRPDGTPDEELAAVVREVTGGRPDEG